MEHLNFYLKYYKYYFDGEIAYTPDYLFEENRQKRLKFNYDSPEVFHNDKDKEFDYVCLWSVDKKKWYKKMSLMSVSEKRQFIADFLSGE